MVHQGPIPGRGQKRRATSNVTTIVRTVVHQPVVPSPRGYFSAALILMTIATTSPAAANAPLARPPAESPAGLPGGTLADLANQFDKSPAIVVAKVNDTPITLGMVADRIRGFPPSMIVLPARKVYQLALSDLIRQRALAIKATQSGLEKDPLTQRRISAATDRELANVLMQHSMPGVVTDKAILDRYNAEVAGKPGPDEVQLRIIVTATLADANAVLQKLRDGMDFGEAARTFSRDSSKAAGGEVGYMLRQKLSPENGAVAFSLSPGQTTAYPVESSGIWFILKCEARRQRGSPSLEEATPELRQEIMHDAALKIIGDARAAVTVTDYGPAGDSSTQATPLH